MPRRLRSRRRPAWLPCCDGACRAQGFDDECRACTDPLQEFSLRRLELHKATEHVEHVQQLRRVLGEPVIGLDVAQG